MGQVHLLQQQPEEQEGPTFGQSTISAEAFVGNNFTLYFINLLITKLCQITILMLFDGK